MTISAYDAYVINNPTNNKQQRTNAMLENLSLFIKGFLALTVIIVAISSIYVYRIWLKDTNRRVKISVMGASIELGEARPSEKEPEEAKPELYTGD